MLLPKDFREFIELMNCTRVRYVMIGGFAYNLYRNPRATGDIDFFVETSEDNEKKIRSVLEQFGFGSTLPSADKTLLLPGKIIMLGRSPMRIDLFTKIDGVNFAEVVETCQIFVIDGLHVPVISRAKLIKNKRASGRPKDLQDVQELCKLFLPP